ncbi:MAG: hypothetical protein H6Q65_952 [Firmicutes bacterium]|nr:hypothetical protein [Bacillota bacterium]
MKKVFAALAFAILFTLVAGPVRLAIAGSAPVFLHEAASLVLSNDNDKPVFWIKLTPTQSGRQLILEARKQVGMDDGGFEAVKEILCRVAVGKNDFEIREEMYLDANSEVIADWTGNENLSSEPTGGLVSQFCLEVLPAYFAPKPNVLKPGFCGLAWGSHPAMVAGARLTENRRTIQMYDAVMDVSALLGDIQAIEPVTLMVSEQYGLIRGVVSFRARDYQKLLERLTDRFGNPRWVAGRDLAWQVNEDVTIDITYFGGGPGRYMGILVVSYRPFFPIERQLFGIPGD